MVEAEGAVFPIAVSHQAILATVHLRSGGRDPFAWKGYRWRAPPPANLARVAALLDVYRALLALTAVDGDTYIAAAHQVAQMMVPLRATPPKVSWNRWPPTLPCSAGGSYTTFTPRSHSGPNSEDTGPEPRPCRTPPSLGPCGKPYNYRMAHFSPLTASPHAPGCAPPTRVTA